MEFLIWSQLWMSKLSCDLKILSEGQRSSFLFLLVHIQTLCDLNHNTYIEPRYKISSLCWIAFAMHYFARDPTNPKCESSSEVSLRVLRLLDWLALAWPSPFSDHFIYIISKKMLSEGKEKRKIYRFWLKSILSHRGMDVFTTLFSCNMSFMLKRKGGWNIIRILVFLSTPFT